MTRRLTPLAAGLLLAGLALAGAGCDTKKPTGNVSGKVTYNGQPQTVGSVNFLSATGAAAQAVLDDSGGYKIEAPLEAGDYKVFLLPPVPGQLPPGSKVAPAAKFTVPPKFQQPGTSGVTATVKAGDNTIPLEFKD